MAYLDENGLEYVLEKLAANGKASYATTAGSANTASSASTCTGNAATATKLKDSHNIKLTGDASGSASFNGTADASITVTIADDSHNHVISNVDGLQTALDGKASTSDLTSHTGNKSNPHGVTAAQVGALSTSGGTVSGDLTVTGKITQGTPSSHDTVASMNRFKADLFVEGSGAAPNNPGVAGFYLGKSQTDDNRHMDIVSGGDYSYIDFNQASSGSDYDARLLVNVNTGDTQWMWGAGMSAPIFNVMGYLRKNGVDVATVNDLGGHTGDKSNPHGVTAEQVGAYTKTQVDAALQTKAGTSTATTSTNGLMSSSDKSKLDGIASGANKYVLPVAGTSIGGVKSGTDITVDSAGNVSVNDNSHAHTIANITNLQSTLDAKVPNTRTVNGKALSSNITLSASDVGADASGTAQTKANAALTSAKTYTDGEIAKLINASDDGVLNSITELADAIEDNQDAIEALNSIASGKAKANHTHSASYTPAGTVGSTSITPAGSVSSTFKGTAAGHSHTFTGTAASHGHNFTGTKATISTKYTPSGSVSSSFSGTSATSGGPSATTTVYSITGVGSAPSLTAAVANRCMTLTFSAGSVPTRSSVTVPTDTHTHNVTATGSVSSGFTGTEATISTDYTPAGSISGTSVTPAGSISETSVTPAGTVSSSFTGTAASHSHGFTGTAATITTGTEK